MGPKTFGVLVIHTTGDARRTELIDELNRQLGSALTDAGERLVTLDAMTYEDLADCTAAVAVVFCGGELVDQARDAIADSVRTSRLVFPVVADLKRFRDLAPKVLHEYNGFELPAGEDVVELATLVLESLGLIREKRKVFISYARHETRAVAVQLHDTLVRRWYSVFLDTHSIRPGETFQEMLKEALVDCDMMVLLTSPEIKTRSYVLEEIAFADQASLGVLQVLWPGCNPLPEAQFFATCSLDRNRDFDDWQAQDAAERRLSEGGLQEVLKAVALQRGAAHEHRERQLVQRLVRHAKRHGRSATVHKGRFINLKRGDESIRIDTVLGLPDSQRIQEAIEARRAGTKADARAKLLYDPLGMTNRMSDHLRFLEDELPLCLVRKSDVEGLVLKE